MKKSVAIFLILTLLCTIFNISGIAASEYEITITSPKPLAAVNGDSVIKVSGTIAQGYTSAAIYIDDTLVSSIDTGLSSYNVDCDLSWCNYGRHTLSVKAIYPDGEVETQQYINLTGCCEKELIGGFPATGYDFTESGVRFYTLMEDSADSIVNSDGIITYKKKSGKTGYFRAFFDPVDYLSGGTYSMEMDISFSNPEVASLNLESKNKTGAWPIVKTLLAGGSFSNTSVTCEANTFYTLKVVVNLDTGEVECSVDDNVIFSETKSDIAPFENIYINLTGLSDNETFTIKNGRFISLTQLMPYPVSLGYIIGEEEIDEENWQNGKLDSLADSVCVNLSEAFDSDSVILSNIDLQKEDGSFVEKSISQRGKKIIITPEDGFDVNEKYMLLLSNMLYDSNQYLKTIEISFETRSSTGIVYPKNGSTVAPDFKKIKFGSRQGCKVSVKLDGEEIAFLTSSGTDTISFENDLPIGSHKISILEFNDKSSNIYESNFNVTVKKEKIILHADFDGGSDSRFNNHGSVSVGKNSEGGDIPLSKKSMTGRNGEENGAIGLMVTDAIDDPDKFTGNTNYFYIDVEEMKLSGIVTIKYDIKMTNQGAFEIETKNATGAWGYIGGAKFLNYDGFVNGTTYKYPLNEWISVKKILDIPSETMSVWINNEKVIDSLALGASVKNLTTLKFQYHASEAISPQGISLDNVSISQETIYSGFDKLSYLQNDGTYAESQNNVIAEQTSVIKLEPLSPFIYDEDVTSEVTVNSTEEDLSVKSAAFDDKGVLAVTFDEQLKGISDVTFTLKASISGIDETLTMVKPFSVDTVAFGISTITYKSDGMEIYSPRQLKSGMDLALDVTLKNTSSEKKEVVVAAVYCKNKLVSLDAKKADDSSIKDGKVTLNISLPEDESDFNIECYLLNSYQNRVALSKVWKMQ